MVAGVGHMQVAALLKKRQQDVWRHAQAVCVLWECMETCGVGLQVHRRALEGLELDWLEFSLQHGQRRSCVVHRWAVGLA